MSAASSQAIDLADRPAPVDLLAIDKEAISKMLKELGVDLTHPLTPAFIIGSFDVMACADVGARLPVGARFPDVMDVFDTMRLPQHPEVREVQARVLDSVCEHCVSLPAQIRQEIIDRMIERQIL